jgi:hypothetical protein
VKVNELKWHLARMPGVIHSYNNFFFKNFRVKDNSLDLGIDNRTLFMCIREICEDVVHTLVILERTARCCKEGQEIFGYIKPGKFLTSCRTTDF